MRDPRVGTAGQVFGAMTREEEAHAAAVFRATSWPALRATVEEARAETLAAAAEVGRSDELRQPVEAEFAEITSKLASRYDAILRQL
jgi:hypothetical protein